MYEVEVKAKLKDRDIILNKLIELGCSFGEELNQIDHIFIPEDISFPPPLDVPVLRIRQQGDKNFFTLKISQSNRQDCIEHELEIFDGQKMLDIMNLIKYKKVPIVNKTRIKSSYQDMEIVIDRVAGLGDFIEVEMIVKEQDPILRLEIQNKLLEFLSFIGVHKDDHIPGAKYDIMLYEKYGLDK